MCTLSWCRQAQGYQLWFNRDESRLRKVAQPPRLDRVEGCAVLAPLDGDALGTWIWVNAHGVTAVVLNHYGARVPRREPLSRGRLLFALAPATGVTALGEALSRQPLEACHGFTLVAVDAAGAQAWRWDGLALTPRPEIADAAFASSSSFAPERVIPWRRRRFEALGPDRDNPRHLEALHREVYLPERAASICMERSDAATVSLCHVEVTPAGARMSYWERELTRCTFADNPHAVRLSAPG